MEPLFFDAQDLPARHLPRGRILVGQDGAPTVDDAAAFDSFRVGGPPAAVHFVIRDQMLAHYFHFLETFILLYCIKMQYFQGVDRISLHVGQQPWNNHKQNGIQQQLIKAVFPLAEVVADDVGVATEHDHLVLIDRMLARTSINKMLDPAIILCMKWGPFLRERVHRSFGIGAPIEPPHGRIGSRQLRPKAIYVQRAPPRCMLPDAEAQFLSILSRYYEIKRVDFAQLSWEQQVRVANSSDLIAGVHGNGLSNITWAQSSAAVLEIFPRNVHHYDYQVLAEIMGLKYIGIEGTNIYPAFSRVGNARGDEITTNLPIQTVARSSVLLALESLRND